MKALRPSDAVLAQQCQAGELLELLQRALAAGDVMGGDQHPTGVVLGAGRQRLIVDRELARGPVTFAPDELGTVESEDAGRSSPQTQG